MTQNQQQQRIQKNKFKKNVGTKQNQTKAMYN